MDRFVTRANVEIVENDDIRPLRVSNRLDCVSVPLDVRNIDKDKVALGSDRPRFLPFDNCSDYKSPAQIIMERYGVASLIGKTKKEEKTWDLRGHVGFIVSRLSRRFAVLKYLCCRRSMDRRLKWTWLDPINTLTSDLDLLIIDPLFETWSVSVKRDAMTGCTTNEDMCIRVLAHVCAAWMFDGHLEPRKHDGDPVYWESLLCMEIDIASRHDDKILEIDESVAILWNQISLMKVSLDKVMAGQQGYLNDVDDMLDKYKANPFNDGLRDHLVELQLHVKKLQQLFEVRSNTHKVLTEEMSCVDICHQRRANAMSYMSGYMDVMTPVSKVLIVDCGFQKNLLTEMAAVVVSFDGVSQEAPRYFGVAGLGKKAKWKKKADGGSYHTESLLAYLVACEPRVKAFLLFDPREDLRILAKIGYVPGVPVYDVQVMVGIWEQRSVQLTGSVGLVDAYNQITGGKSVKGTIMDDLEMTRHLLSWTCRVFPVIQQTYDKKRPLASVVCPESPIADEHGVCRVQL